MNVLMISPGYPSEIPYFVRALAQAGARVLGVSDQPESALPAVAREHLAAYLQVPSFRDEAGAIDAMRGWTDGQRIDRVVALWEPAMFLGARVREALGVPGMTVEETVPFRDKDRMKQILTAAGIRTPRHLRARVGPECRAAAEQIGFPVILKPVAGAGSVDTHRVDDAAQLEDILARMGHVAEVNVEEFVEGEEYTFDTLCIDGQIVFYNIAWYRPRPLIARTTEWISPQTICLRDVDSPDLAQGRAMGPAVLQALDFRTGFTHMEWYCKPDGEAVFGEIAARPPGGRTVDGMNYACDADLFAGWAEAELHGTFSQPVERRYNAAVLFKRAQGAGYIQRIEGLEDLRDRYGEHLVAVELVPVGAPRRDWIEVLISDGFVIVRHPDLEKTIEIADAVGTDLQLYAG
jgi:biotin carboxylase